MDDLPYEVTPYAVTPILALPKTSTRLEYPAPAGSVAPWVAFALYMIVAQAILYAETLGFAGSVLSVAPFGALVVVLAYSVLEQRRQWQAEYQPHGRNAVLVEFSWYLIGLLMICLVVWRLHASTLPSCILGMLSPAATVPGRVAGCL
jgi:hypothetical protein